MDRKEYLMNMARLAQSYGFVPIGIKDKYPRFKNWPNVRIDPADPEKTIRRIGHLYDQGLVNNLSILTGEASGVVVLDIDVPALPWWSELLKLNPELPLTFTVQTPSGGLHYYFKYNESTKKFHNMNSILGQRIDYRTDGGLAVFPGSYNYVVTNGYVNNGPIIAPMPFWLTELLRINNSA